MQKTLSAIFRVVFSITLLFCQAKTYASHILGAELSYTHVTGNTYKVTCVLYGDCSPGSSLPFATLHYANPYICIFDSSIYFTTVHLVIQSPDTGVEVTMLCPGDTSQCLSTTSIIPGVTKFIYSANITLPHTSSCWRFIYTGDNGPGSAAGRAASITNLSAPGSTIMELVDTLNNNTGPNSSIAFTDSLRMNFCINQHDDFTPNPVDPDGDSLYIFLTTATNGSDGGGTSGSCIGSGTLSYIGSAWPGMPISATLPLQVATDSFTLNSHTGDISFYPNAFQRADVLYNIQEYRSGILVGTSQHEFNLVVLDCSSTFPCLSTTPSCSGTPSCIASATVTGGCSSYTSLLSLTGTGPGLAYQWQSSRDSSSWVNVAGAIYDTASVTDTTTTYYRCIIICTGSSEPDTTGGIKLTVDQPNAGMITGSNHVCVDSTIILTDPVPGGTWSSNNAHATVSGGAVTGVAGGTDDINYTVTNACGTYSAIFNITINSGSGCPGSLSNIEAVNSESSSYQVYPDPATSMLTVVSPSPENFIVISDLIGQALIKAYNNTRQMELNISSLAPGIYFIKINGNCVKKFLKQ